MVISEEAYRRTRWCGIAWRLYFFGGGAVGVEEVDSRKLRVETEEKAERGGRIDLADMGRSSAAPVHLEVAGVRLGGDGFVCGDFVDEVAEVAFGVAAVGVAAVCEFVGDLVHQFVYGAAFRGLFVEFELGSEAAQEFGCVDHDEGILRFAGEATNRTGVLGEWIRNFEKISFGGRFTLAAQSTPQAGAIDPFQPHSNNTATTQQPHSNAQ
jgi:hypothetical protein